MANRIGNGVEWNPEVLEDGCEAPLMAYGISP
jgi:hypothetical protein